MNKFLFIILLLLFISCHSEIHSSDADDHIGDKATVCGEVIQIYHSNTTYFINLGAKPFPNQDFTGVIFNLKNVMEYTDFWKLLGEGVCIEGTIQLYKGKPEIIITDFSQLRILNEIKSNENDPYQTPLNSPYN